MSAWHVLLGPPQDAVAGQLRQPLGRRVRRDAARIDEREDVDQVLRPVLDRRAGQRPAPRRGGCDRTTWAVFDSRFLIRCASSSTTTSNATRVVVDELGVAREQLVVDELERAVGDEPRRPAQVGVAADDLERQVGGPQLQLARPVEDERLRADDQRRCGSCPAWSSSRSARIACTVLPEPHLVGEQGRVPRHQEGDAFELVRERLKRHLDLPWPPNRSSSGGCSR